MTTNEPSTAQRFEAAIADAPHPEPVVWKIKGPIQDLSRDLSMYQTRTYTEPLYDTPYEAPTPVATQPQGEREALIGKMVDRFLCWKLPKVFFPDAGVAFKPSVNYESPCWPTGTNLLTAEQAREMVTNMLAADAQPYDPIGAWNKGFEDGKRAQQVVAPKAQIQDLQSVHDAVIIDTLNQRCVALIKELNQLKQPVTDAEVDAAVDLFYQPGPRDVSMRRAIEAFLASRRQA